MQQREKIRNKLKEKHGSKENEDRICKCLKDEYEKRLKTKYKKSNKTFYEQFREGQGNELEEKFWSPASSSRYAFEMYSWLANNDLCTFIEFEYLLPQIYDAKGRNNVKKVPDMDVFFILNDDLFFIESKFMELNNLYEKPSISYYENNKGPKSLLRRYHDSSAVSSAIPAMIKDIYKYLGEVTDKTKCDWFYPKQEITHLVGISLFLLENPKIIQDIKSKKIQLNFYNVVYKVESDKNEINDFRLKFILSAKKAFKEMFSIDLNYQIKYSQDFILELLNLSKDGLLTKGYSSDKTVIELLEQFDCEK